MKKLESEWMETLNKLSERKQHLESMQDEYKNLSNAYEEFLNKINNMEQKVESLPELSFGKDTLKRQKTDYKVEINTLFSLRLKLITIIILYRY